MDNFCMQSGFSGKSWSSDNYDEKLNYYSMAYGHHYTIPKIYHGEKVKVMDISHNYINCLEPIRFCINLTSLVADNNMISEKTTLPYLPNVELIWMNHCKIKSLHPWIKKLKLSCPNLKYLSLMDNPGVPSYLNGGTYYEYLQYRLFVVSVFPNLIHLDDRIIDWIEREKSYKKYKSSFIEKIRMFDCKTLSFAPKFLIDKKWNNVEEQENDIIILNNEKPPNFLI